MSRTPQFFIKFLAVALCISAALQVMASLPDQPAPAPAHTPALTSSTQFDFGAFSAIDSLAIFNDPKRAFAYDNFTLTGSYQLDSICWSGNCAANLSSPASDTDFLIRIFTDELHVPDLGTIAARVSHPPNLNVASLGYSAPVVTATDLVVDEAAFTIDAPL